ncbi:MAG: Uma2 family endonuclease [Planctomycetaceae bacterium]
MATATTLLTAEEFAQLPDTVPYELVRGELVEMNRPTIRHGLVSRNVVFALAQWARQESAGFVLPNHTGVVTERDPDSVRGPDCFFIRSDRAPADFAAAKWLEIPPDLAVEVLSPGDRWKVVVAKVGEHLACGVVEVWVLDPEDRELSVFRADERPVTLAEDDRVANESLLPGFECCVSEFFRDV